MLKSRYCFRKPGETSPQLGLAQSFWALTARPLSLTQSLELACAQGFEYFEVGLREERLSQTSALLRQFPLRLIAQGWAISSKEAVVFLDHAVELGAIAINMHLGNAYMTQDEALALISSVRELAANRNLPVLIETHRGRLTQDLTTTTRLLSRLPDLPVTLDVSHYLVAGETLGGSEPCFFEHVVPLLHQTALIHGRISNGQSVQVCAADNFAFTSIIRFLWTQAMKSWLVQAPADAVFIFEPELGPPPYAYLNSAGEETFDRTQESQALTSIARQCWAEAHNSLSESTSNLPVISK